MTNPRKSNYKKLTALVKGAVQGVGYRYFVLEHAGKLQLNGWVENLPDGGVRVVAQGEENDLLQLLELLKQGPRHALVQNVGPIWESGERTGGDFRVKF